MDRKPVIPLQQSITAGPRPDPFGTLRIIPTSWQEEKLASALFSSRVAYVAVATEAKFNQTNHVSLVDAHKDEKISPAHL